MKRALIAMSIALTTVCAARAHEAESLRVVYSVPGVLNGTSRLFTIFSCTSTDSQPIKFAVVTYGTAGDVRNSYVPGGYTLNPHQSMWFATDSASHDPFNILNFGDGTVVPGSAEILSTSSQIVCAAYLVDDNVSPSRPVLALPVIPKAEPKH